MRRLRLTGFLLLAACKVGPDYVPPVIDLPDHWGGKAAEGANDETGVPRDWWKLFHDDTLSALEEEGLKNSTDLLIAAARVAEARAQLHLAEADLYPEIDVQGNATRTKSSGQSTLARSTSAYNDFGVAAVLNYEIDLWGRLRRAEESARATLLSSQANREAIRLAVASDIATGYFTMLALDAQIEVTNLTIQSRSASYEYELKQFKGGQIDALTYRQAEGDLAAAQAALPLLIQQRTEQENALAILLGRSPRELVEKIMARGLKLNALPVPPVMPADLPSTLLERRPDIAGAEQELIAANAAIGFATADYFPTLSLRALIGLDSASAGNLIRGSARNGQLGANVIGPVFDAGRTTANVDAAKARADNARAIYQQVVQNAFAETLNSMSGVITASDRVKAQAAQVTARKEANRIAGRRFDAGYSDQLEYLDTERNLYQAQLDSIEAMRDQLSASVTLYKALGGGWDLKK